MSLQPCQFDAVVFCQMAVPDKFGIYLEAVKVPIEKNMDVLTCLALFCILHYTCCNGMCFSLECCGVVPKAEALSPC
jgi:hypothetical protein